MDPMERRKHKRIETKNLISQGSISKKGEIVSHSIAKALNVSQSGLMLQTVDPIPTESISLKTIYLDNNLIKSRGKVIYCRKTQSGMYQSGIKFTGSEDETSMFAVKLIKLYHHKLIMQGVAKSDSDALSLLSAKYSMLGLIKKTAFPVFKRFQLKLSA